jgi:hypothetical protein
MAGEKAVVTPGWCTNWEAFNTPRIWAMVADEDNAESWRQIAALGAMADTVKDQRNRLLGAREALVAAWPPGANPGAQALVTHVDTLLANMADTKAKADDNAAHLGHVLETLRRAKAKIEPLYQQYLDKSDDLIPNWWDNAEDGLDKQARLHMIDAERDVATHAEKIVSPAPYRLVMGNPHDKNEREFPQSETTSRSASAPAAMASAGGAAIDVPHEPPPPLPGRDATLPAGPASSGPDLAGISPVAPGNSANVPPVSPQIPATPAVPSQPGFVIGGGGAFSPMSRGGPPRSTVNTFGGSPVGRGAYAGAKPATPAWLPVGTGQTGLLGSMGRPGQGAAGKPGPSGQMVTGTGVPGQRGKRQGTGKSAMEFDPDDPWATAEGVSPVIEPSLHEPLHDPGPGVIGWRE